MKYLAYICIVLVVASLLSLAGADFARAEINVLQPKGETRWSTGDNSGIRDFVEDTFGDDHIMVDVARCESGFRQYYAGGDVLIAGDEKAVGVFQLLETWHENPAAELGYDIYTVEGNVGYAQDLYEAEGLKPWSPSSLCWDDGRVAETNVDGASSDNSQRTHIVVRRDNRTRDARNIEKESVSDNKSETDSDQQLLGSTNPDKSSEVPLVISKRLIIGVDDPEVKILQELLNTLGYELTKSGPGSSGEETSFFGSLTKQALQKLQCEEDIICSGVEYTTGFGMTDEKTRTVLNKLAADAPNRSSGNRVVMPVRTNTDPESEGGDQSDLQTQIDQLIRLVKSLQQQLSQN